MEPIEQAVVPADQGRESYAVSENREELLSRRYRGRGAAGAVRREVEEQMRHEEATRELAPDAYRLSSLSEETINGSYRKGKENMELGDLLDYFSETRQRRIRSADFTENNGVDVLPVEKSEDETRALEASEQVRPVVQSRRLSGLVEATRGWFDGSSGEKAEGSAQRFPVSVIAAIVTVSISLMLIVAGSVMTRRAEKKVSELSDSISDAYVVLSDLEADLEVRDDLLVIREIAVKEYGMVGSEYVRSQYITLSEEDRIEVFEEEDDTMALSALLSAIGVKK